MKKRDNIFKELVRENTGTHMLDSGGESGRHWQRPLGPSGVYFDTYKETPQFEDISINISLYSFLESNLAPSELQAVIDCANESGAELRWSEDIADYLAEMTDLKVITSNNTCNYDNDLDQGLLYTILSDSQDWYNSSKTIIIIQTHNGADIRGGYSTPLVCELVGDRFFDMEAGLYVRERDNIDSPDFEDYLPGHYGCSYSCLEEFNKTYYPEIIEYSAEKITAKLNDGRLVEIYPHAALDW